MELITTTNVAETWRAVESNFVGNPAVSNWILSALRSNAESGRGGFRYCLIGSTGEVSGIGVLTEESGRLDLSPMDPAGATAVADSLFEHTTTLQGVLGPAAPAAAFAGRWTELANVGARPTDGGRVLEVRNLIVPRSAPAGKARKATVEDLDLVVTWNAGFAADTDVAPHNDPAAHLGERILAGTVWVWDQAAGPVAMAIRTTPTFATRRIAHVYTPPEQRGRGLASALVGELASETLAEGDRCMLHTQLSNSLSNGVYRRLGFKAISDSTFYEFLT